MSTKTMLNKIACMDCIEGMKRLEDNSIDMVLCDLPYGITNCEWDEIIPLDKLWEQYKRIIKDRGTIVLTASQPFTSKLVMTNIEMFKHEWIWIKNRGSNFANTIREPFKEHETVLVFANKKWKYNPKMQERTGKGLERVNYELNWKSKSNNYREFDDKLRQKRPDQRVPSSWQKFNMDNGLHPTQKPIKLFEYLIKTYTDEGDIVLDNCIGSGTTAVACKLTGRNYIGFEISKEYCDLAEKRIKSIQGTDENLSKWVKK